MHTQESRDGALLEIEMDAILIEQTGVSKSVWYLRHESDTHPYGFVERINGKWWAAIPGSFGAYFDTRNQAIAAIV